MFRKWLGENKVENFDFSQPLFPKGSDREFWESKSKQKYIEDAEGYLNHTWMPIKASDYIIFYTEGTRSNQERPHFSRRNALMSLILGELCEYKGRFIPDITDGLFLICEETFWGISAHYPLNDTDKLLPDAKNCYIDLFAGETASIVALCYYLLYDELYDYCPDILIRVEYEMKRRILDPYLENTGYWWMGYTNWANNWNPWIISNMLTAFLLMENSQVRKCKAIRKMMYEINTIYTHYPDDGGCEEGATYWTVSGATLFEFIYQLYVSTNGKINFLNDEKFRRIMEYPYHTYITDGKYVNFGDGMPTMHPQMLSILYLYGKTSGNTKMCEMAKRLCKEYGDEVKDVLVHNSSELFKRSLQLFILMDELSQADNFTAADSHIYPDLQIAYIRSDKWYCGAKGGSNIESHGHNDVGNFLLYDDATPVLLDPGCGAYTANTFNEHRYEIWTMQSDWHNIPKINGISQRYGHEYRADRFEMTNGAITVSYKDAYPQESGLKDCMRKIWFENGALNISDKFAFEKDKNTVCEHFMTTFEPKVDGNKIIFGSYVLECDGNCEISYDVQLFNGDKKLVNAWQSDRLYRIILKYNAGSELENRIAVKKV